MAEKLIDQKTKGYDRWCEAAKRAHLTEWDTAKPETREPWIIQARQKEEDDEARRAANRSAAGGLDKLKPGVNPPVVGKPAVPADGLGRPRLK
jgi:hypothetical protein